MFHGSELARVFGFDELLLTEAERALAKRTIDFWTSFAQNGQLVATRMERDDADVFQWPAWSRSSERSLELDITLAVQEEFKHAICDMWDAADTDRVRSIIAHLAVTVLL